MATISWNAAGTSGDWNLAANWAGGQLPAATDTVSLAAAKSATITIGAADAETVAAIVAGSGTNDAIALTGGSLAITGDAAIGSGLAITAGTLRLGVATTLGGTPGAQLANAGTITKAAGNQTATVLLDTINTGLISVGAGTLRFTGAVTQNGSLGVADGATLDLAGGGTLGGSIHTTGTGAIMLEGAWTQAAAALSLAGNLGLAGSLTFTGGQSLTLAGSTTFDAALSGTGTLTTQGPVTVDGGSVTDGAAWFDSGAMAFAANAQLTLDGGALAIGAGGSVVLNNGSAIASVMHVDPLTNAGTITVNAPTESATITAATTNTGTISVTAGELVMDGALTNSGTLNATHGELLAIGPVNETGTLNVGNGAQIQLVGGGTLGGNLSETGTGSVLFDGVWTMAPKALAWNGNVTLGGWLNFVAGQSLTLTGPTTLSSELRNAGSLTTSGPVTIAGGGMFSGVTWSDSGAITFAPDTEFFDYASSLTISASGSLALTDGAQLVTDTTATIINAGTISRTTGTRYSQIMGVITNTGTITVTTGSLQLGMTVANSGTISDTGALLDLGTYSGSGALNATSSAKVYFDDGGTLGNTLHVDASSTVVLWSGTFTLAGTALEWTFLTNIYGLVQLSSGQTFTLDNVGSYGGSTFNATPSLSGAGTLIGRGTSTEAGYAVGDGATWQIEGTVTQSSADLTLGQAASAGGAAGTLVVAASGDLNLSDDTGIANAPGNGAPTGTGQVRNAGLIAKTGGAGTSHIAVAVANSGTIAAQSGTLAIDAAITGTGTLAIAGNATLELAQAPAAGQTIVFEGEGLVPGGGSGSAPGAHLVLDTLGSAAVSGLANADTIDFAGITITSAVISGNTLTVTDSGGHTARFTSATSLANTTTKITSDGKTGSIVTFGAPAPAGAILQQTNVTGYVLTPTQGVAIALDLTNTALLGSGVSLDAAIVATSGPVTASGGVTGLPADTYSPGAVKLQVDPTATGAFTATVTVGFTSIGNYPVKLPDQTITVTGTVIPDAAPQFTLPAGYVLSGNAASGYTLNLGTRTLGYAAFALPVGVLNAAPAGAATLGGQVAGHDALLTNAGTGQLGQLGGGQAVSEAFTVNSLGLGLQSETIEIDPTETYGNNVANLAAIRLTVTLNVVTTKATIYALDGKGGALNADTHTNSIFQITAAALKASAATPVGGWSLHGSQGVNQFQLIGAGTFNLNQLSSAINIGTIVVTEGQRTYAGIAATRQGVILRNGDTEVVQVNSAAAVAGNPLQVGTDIVAGSGTYTIMLGTGHDHVQLGSGTATVYLGQMGNSVIGGNGSAAIVGNLFQSQAVIQGNGTGTLTLYVNRAGSVTLNALDTNLTVALKAGSTLNMGAGSGIIADGRAGNDTINAQATAQTLIGGNGDVLNGAAAGGDTFEFTKFCGTDTVNGFIASGTNHDMLAISTKAFADFAHLLGATKQVGNDLMITIDAADTILLKNVALASFTSADVRFF